ncbi:MAG: hypothetical protein K0B10_11690 [Vicingaceae bacterium]|nr:hypothetical protein [Vicingaceae bacterium]
MKNKPISYVNIRNHRNKDTICNHLDISINASIIFNNGESILKSFKNIKNVWGRNDRVYFTTVDSSIYISLGLNYGGGPNEYKDAKIGYVIGNVTNFIPEEIMNSSFNPSKDYLTPKFYFTQSDFQDFISGYGIKLGISEEELINKTLSNGCKLVKKELGNRTIYVYENEYCVYEANYVFEKNKLIQFSFGYITP